MSQSEPDVMSQRAQIEASQEDHRAMKCLASNKISPFCKIALKIV